MDADDNIMRLSRSKHGSDCWVRSEENIFILRKYIQVHAISHQVFSIFPDSFLAASK